MDYRREIDGLRALAVLPVILFHAGYEAFGGGFVGVDVFFVISGYLITGIIVAQSRQGTFSLLGFYERRARRLFPVLFLVMAACIPVAWYWLLPGDMKDFSQSLAATAVFASNILFWMESGYFDADAELKPLLHTWSLGIEEQFYVLFPLLLLLVLRRSVPWTRWVMATAWVASFATAQRLATTMPDAAFFLLPTRAWELLAGALLALAPAQTTPATMRPWVAEAGGWLGLALIAYPVFAYDRSTPFPGFAALPPALGAVLVIACASRATSAGKLLGSRLLVGIGLLSYSAYVWHQPLFAFFKHHDSLHRGALPPWLLALTLLLALVTHRYVETPWRNGGTVRRPVFVASSILGLVFFLVFGYQGHVSNGFVDRTHMRAFRDLAPDTSRLQTPGCDAVLTKEAPRLNLCHGSSLQPTALLVGDSHAEDKFVGIEAFSRNFRWGLLGNLSCPPLRGTRFKSLDGTDCSAKLDKLFSFIEGQPSVRLVVLSFAHMYPLTDFVALDHVRHGFASKNPVIEDPLDPSAGKVAAFYAGLRRTVEFLQQRNIRTVITLDVPELAFFPSDCLRAKVACTFRRDDVITRQTVLREQVSRLQQEFRGLLVFDPLDVFCSAGECSILNQGRPMYSDSHHLNRFGSFQYGSHFAEWYGKNEKSPQSP